VPLIDNEINNQQTLFRRDYKVTIHTFIQWFNLLKQMKIQARVPDINSSCVSRHKR
jgi:hypothetical protein